MLQNGIKKTLSRSGVITGSGENDWLAVIK
jgi:hypothetical protein